MNSRTYTVTSLLFFPHLCLPSTVTRHHPRYCLVPTFLVLPVTLTIPVDDTPTSIAVAQSEYKCGHLGLETKVAVLHAKVAALTQQLMVTRAKAYADVA
jgi:hypothetical protein